MAAPHTAEIPVAKITSAKEAEANVAPAVVDAVTADIFSKPYAKLIFNCPKRFITRIPTNPPDSLVIIKPFRFSPVIPNKRLPRFPEQPLSSVFILSLFYRINTLLSALVYL
jgi:hypothetical protein